MAESCVLSIKCMDGQYLSSCPAILTEKNCLNRRSRLRDPESNPGPRKYEA